MPPSNVRSSASIFRIALGVVVGVGAVWIFLPGIFDARSPSIFGSENRRSPLVSIAGPRTVVDDSIQIREDQFGGYSFELKVPSKVSVTVTREKGPGFEVYMVEQSGYDEFKTAANSFFGGNFHHFTEFEGVVNAKVPSLRKDGVMKSGKYVVMLDNSDYGKVSPPANFSDDVVTARVKVVVE